MSEPLWWLFIEPLVLILICIFVAPLFERAWKNLDTSSILDDRRDLREYEIDEYEIEIDEW